MILPSPRTRLLIVASLLVALALNTAPAEAEANQQEFAQQEFDVVIAGGSTAAFAAAIASAKSGARTALLEPTDWVGGQLTSSGVPAVDEAWHAMKDASGEVKLNVAKIARTPANITPSFRQILADYREPGRCWVSRFCFQPDRLRTGQLLPLQHAAGDKLVVFLETVVKQVELSGDGKRVQSLMAIRRIPREGVRARGYDRLPSEDLAAWYSPESSERFEKETLRFNGAVFIDATEWGELLALSDAPYLVGVDRHEGATTGNEQCGQSTVFCFVQALLAEPSEEVLTVDTSVRDDGTYGYGDYEGRGDGPQWAWNQIWTYRRLHGTGPPAVGDFCLQNWGYSPKRGQGGNDYPFAYLFKDKAETAAERADWQGGINLPAMAAAEQRAFGWHEWFRKNAPEGIDPAQIRLAPEVLGTGHGLAKLPYIRDTRRSVGLDGFLLEFADLTGKPEQMTGRKFADRIALGAYPMDVHPLSSCEMPEYIQSAPHDTLPFYIPFRALTNQRLENVLVAGKTMAQTFLANSATRLHPIEWSTGTAAGVTAAHMARHSRSSREAYDHIEQVRALVAEQTPTEWTLPE